MKHIVFFLLFFVANATVIRAQTGKPVRIWSDRDETTIPAIGGRQIKPAIYRTVRADEAALKTLLFSAPDETQRPASQSTAILTLPLPEGGFQYFRIVRYQMLAPELAAQYPQIGTWHGTSDDKTWSSVRVDWTERGFHAMVRRPGGSYFIDPYRVGNTADYLVYYKKDYPQPEARFRCEVPDDAKENLLPEADEAAKAGDCVFRSYRLALATTGEYSNYHGADDPSEAGLVLSAVTTAINRVNEVYERDLAIRLLLIAGTTAVFYYDPDSDPYTNDSGGAMLTENQNTLNTVIGPSNFDIGHVFSTGGGGVATLNGPCGTNKARGVTGLSNPVNDPFYIDYVAHEIGHQFGARHTFNNSCEGNRSVTTAMEPGSGSTIMAYAGICHPNVQPNSDDYFHAISLRDISLFVAIGTGNNCDTPIAFDNDPPSVSAGINYTIPASTPFVLSAVASDPDGDPITYCWEQWDPEIGEVMPPASTNLQGPMFRSFEPSTSPRRYFPRLQDLVNNAAPAWEVLSSVTRPLEFRVTVRDFADMTAGCTDEDNLFVNVNATSGPFLVIEPNTAVTWTEGQTYTVNWDVALTDQPPVNCDSVDIFLSYDGGLTYPVTLASGLPNNGSAQVILPAGITTTARVMVKGNDHIFFDISNVNFTILSGAPDFAMSATPSGALLCPAGSIDIELNLVSFGGFSEPIILSVNGAPPGTTLSFDNNPVTPTGIAVLTLGNLAAASPGVYNLTITGTTASTVKDIPVVITLLQVPAATALVTPANSAADIPLFPVLSWNSDLNANAYEWQISSNATFSAIVAAGTSFGTTATPDTELTSGTTYYWRVRGVGVCGGAGEWSATRSFITVPCIVFNSSDVPLPISDVGTPVVNSSLIIPETGTLTDLNVINLTGTHTWISDLIITLISPDNTSVVLFDQSCMDQDNFNLNYDMQAATATLPCPPTTGGTFRPAGNLNLVNGQDITGTWTLRLQDLADDDGGQLNSWGLRVCPTGYSGILPVEWLEFSAEAVGGAAHLAWATAVELNNAGFEVQRRTTHSGAFLPVGWAPARGDGSERTDYRFIDRDAPKGEPVYYRLRQVDHDGGEAYSPVRSLTLPTGNQVNWRVFPNPSAGICTLEAAGIPAGQELQAVVVNAGGQEVLRTHYHTGNLMQLDMTSLPQGVYSIKVQWKDSLWTGRIVALHP